MMVLLISFNGWSQTYFKDVQPIILANCVPCHFNGGPAPFPLTSYEEVSAKASTIEEVVRLGFMPPWVPDTGYSHFVGERYLSSEEKQTIESWVLGGKKKGRGQELKVHAANEAFRADLKLGLGKVEVDTNVTDLYRFFIIPNPFKEDTTLSAIKFNPGNPKIVHHAWVFADTVGFNLRGVRTDVVTEFSDLGFPFTDVLTGYLPGFSAAEFPSETGKRLYGESNLVVQVHYYSPSGVFRDSSQIEFQFSKTQDLEPVKTMLVLEKNLVEPPLLIKANEMTTELVEKAVNDSIVLLRIGPHMHTRGKAVKAYAVTLSSDTIPLIKINDWDFNWQGYYAFAEPVLIPAGSRIRMEATYDNTVGNPANPVLPPVDVGYGLGSLNEMCEMAIEYVRFRKGLDLKWRN